MVMVGTWSQVKRREVGMIVPRSLPTRILSSRSRQIQLSNHKEIISAHKSSINSLQIDTTEGRYLLAGASDASAAVYDTQRASYHDSKLNNSKHEALFLVDKRLQQGHRYAVSSVSWYPVDTGIFVTGSYDNYVKVWDTNTTQVELQFKMQGKVYVVAMSQISTTHMLIAAGTEDHRVRLCDIATGAFTHTLTGHRDGVQAACWSTSNEWMLMTGGCDGAIRFWDIRRAGCFCVLDQHNIQMSRRPAIKQRKQDLHSSIGNVQKERHRNVEGAGTNLPVSLSKSRVSNMKDNVFGKDNHTTSHYGAITGLQATPDGFYLLSAGTDSRIRLWDVESGCNTLVNYPSTRIHRNRGIQIVVSIDSSLLFAPSANMIQVYDVWTGHLHSSLKGHYDVVNCCAVHPHDQDLYSGSNDRQILVWNPPIVMDIEENNHHGDNFLQADEDAWSD